MPLVAPLVALDVLVLVLWTIAAALAIALIMRKIGDVFRAVPVVGGYIAGAVDSVAQTISWAAGKLESGVDKAIGAAWHLCARYLDHLWSHLVASSGVLVHLAQLVSRLIHSLAHIRALIHHATGAIAHVVPRVKTLEREWHGIEHRVKTLERQIARGIGHDLRIHVKALERELGRVEHRVIPSIRSIADTAESEVTALRKWVEDHTLEAGTAAFAGAVVWALGRLGLGGLRCNSLLNSMNKRGCGLWNGIEDLLGLFVDTLLLTNVCTLVPVLESAVSTVADPLVIALTDVGAGLCSGGIGPAPALQVPALSLPASPGFTLDLP